MIIRLLIQMKSVKYSIWVVRYYQHAKPVVLTGWQGYQRIVVYILLFLLSL